MIARRSVYGLSCAALVASALPALAVDYTWTGGGTAWSAAANWNPNTGIPQTIDDTAKILNAGGTASVVLDDINIKLKTFTLDSPGTFFNVSGKSVEVSNSATFTRGRVFLNNATWAGTGTLTNNIPLTESLTIQGNTTISAPFVNNGAMQVSGSNTGNAPIDTNLKIGSFENKGRVRLNANSGTGDSSITLDNGNGTLTNSNLFEVEVTTGGARSLEGTLVNSKNATITIAKQFTVVGNANAVHINNGLITITNKAVFAVYGKGFTNEAGATIKGVGKFDRSNIPGANFTNRGFIDPGLSPGLLEIEGDYLEESTAQLNIELGGTIVESQYDQLLINGAATLAGMLSVSLIDGFVPSGSDTFIVLDAKNGISSTYLNAPNDGSLLAVNGGVFQVHYVSGPGLQEMVILDNFLAATPIPEPAAMTVFAGAAALLFKRRTRR
jgi:hypothetical protein